MDSIPFIKKFGRLFLNPNRYENIKSDLRKGESFLGRVIEKFSESKYLIRLKGEDVIAESENPLKEGEQYDFKVVNLKPKITLKILIPDLNTLEGKIEFLNQIKLSHSNINLSILDFFINNALPINRGELLILSSVLNSLYSSIKSDDEIKKKAKSAFLLYQKGIPIKKELIENITYFLFERPEIDRQISEIISLLKKLKDSNISIEKEIVESLLLKLEKIILKAEKNRDFQVLKNYFSLLGLDYEAKISEFVNEDANIPEFLKHSGLKGNLLYLLMILDVNRELFSENMEIYIKLRSSIENIIKFVEFQQIMNYNTESERKEYYINYYYLVPTFYQDKLFPVDIIFREKRERKNIPKKFNITIFIFINKETFLEVNIEIFQNDIEIVFKSENERFLHLLERFHEELKVPIDSLGFNIKSISFEESKDIMIERENLLFGALIKRVKKIDVVI